MHLLTRCADKRIGEIVSTLHAQVYWLTQCKQQYLDHGQPYAAEDFGYAEALAREAVKDLGNLDQELSAANTPAEISAPGL